MGLSGTGCCTLMSRGGRDCLTIPPPAVDSDQPPGPEHFVLRPGSEGQQDKQRWLFFTPSPSSSLMVSGNGSMRCTGAFALSTVVRPSRLTTIGSAPLLRR